MKKLNFMFGTQKMTREQMKNVVGGEEEYKNCCVTCPTICSYNSALSEWNYGNCNTHGSWGDPAVCDNYCCADPASTYWCNC